MSLDFAPEWMDAATDPDRLTPVAPPLAAAPSHPTTPQLARLVEELFAEGALSLDQLRSLGKLPELAPLLEGTLAGAARSRRPLKAR